MKAKKGSWTLRPDQIRQVIRFIETHPQASARSIAEGTGVSHQSVTRLKKRLEGIELTEEILSRDSTLLETLYPKGAARTTTKVEPNYEEIASQLQEHRHLTRELLFEEYRGVNGENAYSYSEFCRKLARSMDSSELTMLLTHAKASSVMVDYAGDTIPIYDTTSGEVALNAQVFVATLAYSGYTYVGVYASQGLADFITGITDALGFFGGLPETIIPDNLRSAVTKHTGDELIYNRTFSEFCTHYSLEPSATRPRKPRDKAKVENNVYLAETRILAALRNERFFSVSEANARVHSLLESLNARPFKYLSGSRTSRFQEERPFLRPLPTERYELARFYTLPVGSNYHFTFETNRYSVPYRYRNRKVTVKVSNRSLEVFSDNVGICVHDRAVGTNGIITNPSHLPSEHARYLNGVEPLYEQARCIGQSTAAVVTRIVETSSFKSTGIASAKGLLRLGRSYSADDVEKACERALAIGSPTRESVTSILAKGLIGQEPLGNVRIANDSHGNIRGRESFRTLGQP